MFPTCKYNGRSLFCSIYIQLLKVLGCFLEHSHSIPKWQRKTLSAYIVKACFITGTFNINPVGGQAIQMPQALAWGGEVTLAIPLTHPPEPLPEAIGRGPSECTRSLRETVFAATSWSNQAHSEGLPTPSWRCREPFRDTQSCRGRICWGRTLEMCSQASTP